MSVEEPVVLRRRRRSRIDTPEPRRLRLLTDAYANEDFDCDDESLVMAWVWKLLDICTFMFQTGALCVGVFIWIGLVILTALWNFARWALTCQGCLVLFPVTLGGCLFAALVLLEDYGTASHVYTHLQHHGVELGKADGTEGLQLDTSVTRDKTLGFGYIARRTALDLVAESGHVPLAKALLDVGALPDTGRTLGPGGVLGGSSPVVEAAKHGHHAMIELLLEAGANAYDGWRYGPFGGVLRKTAPLIEAASNGHLAAVRTLLNAGAAVDVGWEIGPGAFFGSGTPLRSAACGGHVNIVGELVGAGAAPDAGWAFGPMGVLWGDSPLLCAVWNGDLTMVRALLEAGAAPNPRGEGEELRKAASLGHISVVRALLEARAVPDARGRDLQGAVRSGHNDVTEALIQAARGNRDVRPN